MDGGWIKLWRKSQESAVFDNPDLWYLWTWLLMNANWESRQLLNGQTLDPGQLVVSQQRLAQRFGCGKSSIGRRLSKLEKMGNIRLSGGQGGTVVTITHWLTYQQDEGEGGPTSGPQADRRRTVGGPKADIEEEGKKERRKEGKKHKGGSRPFDLVLTDKLRDHAKSKGRDPDEVFTSLRDYCLSKGKQYVDYEAAYRNFCKSNLWGGASKGTPGDPRGNMATVKRYIEGLSDDES